MFLGRVFPPQTRAYSCGLDLALPTDFAGLAGLDEGGDGGTRRDGACQPHHPASPARKGRQKTMGVLEGLKAEPTPLGAGRLSLTAKARKSSRSRDVGLYSCQRIQAVINCSLSTYGPACAKLLCELRKTAGPAEAGSEARPGCDFLRKSTSLILPAAWKPSAF